MATGKRKVQLGAEFDATGARAGFEEVKQGARDMAQTVEQAGKKASAGVDGIGAGADKSAKQVDLATKSLIGSIQRTTAAQEAGSRSSADYYRVLAGQRGIDLTALKPYLDQLDAVAAKQRQATQALGAGNTALAATGVSAAQTTNALRGVPAQFTDIVTSLQGGQNALTVFLQQGGQLKDMFGGAGNAARALGGYVLGLVNPFSIAALAVGALGVAYYQGSQEATAYNKAIVLSGNVAGTTAGQLQTYAQAIAAISGTQGAAAAALAEFVSQSKVQNANLQEFTRSAIGFEKATGQSVATTAKQFAELGKAPLDATLKLNEAYGYLTTSVYQQIKALSDAGRTTDAANLAQKAYADTLQLRTAQITQNLGSIERGWLAVKSAISGAADAALNVGRGTSNTDQLAALQTRLAAQQKEREGAGEYGRAGIDKGIAILKEQINLLQERERMEKRGADAQASRLDLQRRLTEFDRQADQVQSNAEKRRKEIDKARADGQVLVNAGLITEKDLRAQISAIEEKYKDKVGAAGTGQSEVAAIRARTAEQQRYLELLRAQGAEAVKVTEGEKLVARIQEELKTSISGVARAEKERALQAAQAQAAVDKQVVAEQRRIAGLERSKTAYDAMIDATAKSAAALGTQADELEASNVQWGKGRAAIEAYRLALVQAKLAEVEGGSDSSYDPAYVAQLRLQVANQERLTSAARVADLNTLVQKQTEYARSVQEEAAAYADEAALSGVTSAERAKILAVRKIELDLAKRLAEIDRTGGADADSEARRVKLRIEATATAQQEATTAVIKATADEGVKMADQIGTSLTDAILRGFESGKSIAENFRDTVVNMFKTLVLRPIINATVSAGTNAALSALGVGGGAASGGGGGSLSNLASLGSSAYQAATGNSLLGSAISYAGVATGAGAAAGSAGVIAAGNAAYAGALAGGASAASAAASAGVAAGTAATGTGALAGVGGSISAGLAAVPVYGWIALAAVALYSTLKGGETRMGGQYDTTHGTGGAAGLIVGPSGGEIAGTGVKDAITATVSGINDLFKTLGSTTAVTYFNAGLESSKNGKGFTYAGGTLSTGQNFGEGFGTGYQNNRGDKTAEEALAQFSVELQQSVLLSLQTATDIPKAIKDMVAGIDVNKLDAAGVQEVLSQINTVVSTVKGFGVAVELLPFANLRKLSFDATTSLLGLTGGLENFNTTLTSYYGNYYTEAERNANTLKNLTASFASLGLTLPTTREGFRSLVDSQNLATEAGRNTYAMLLGLADAFAGITPTAQAAADAVAAAAEAAAKQAAANKAAALSVADNAYAGLQRAASARIEQLQTGQMAAQQLAAEVSSLFDLLKSNVAELYAAASLPLQSAAQGRQFIDQALSAGRATGALPEQEALAAAISAARGGLDASNFATALEQQRDTLALAARLADLQGLAGDQKTVAEQQVAYYTAEIAATQSLVDIGKSQLDVLKGVDVSVLTVAAALANFQATLLGVRAADPSLPGFAVGTNFVPRTMRAIVHEGERIIPAADNRALFAALQGGGGSADVVLELRGLSARLEAIESNTRATALHANGTKRALERAMPDGDALAVREATL